MRKKKQSTSSPFETQLISPPKTQSLEDVSMSGSTLSSLPPTNPSRLPSISEIGESSYV